MNLRFAFRVDSAVQIGSGHVMRCLTLANNLREQGAETAFICRDHKGNLAGLIRQQGHLLYLLPAPNLAIQEQPNSQDNPPHQSWLGETWETDAAQTAAILADDQAIDWLVVDHYALDSRWQRTLRKHCRHIMVIDDLADRPHDCDLLLDQTLGRDKKDYGNWVPKYCTVLAGAEYALLRPEFSQWRSYSLQHREDPALRQLLINMGGVDSNNITSAILQELRKTRLPDYMHIMVVLGANSPCMKQIEQLAASMPVRTTVKSGVDNMAEIMAGSDLAIGAAGTTSWERCCLGLPTLMFVLADNQIEVAQTLASEGAAIILQCPSEVLARLEYAVPRLAELSAKAAGLIDGLGTEKVVRQIQAIEMTALQSDTKTRIMGEADLPLVLSWRNHPDIRQYMYTRHIITPGEHREWFENASDDKNKVLLIFELNGQPWGFIQFKQRADNKTADWGFYLAPDAGKGIGRLLGEAALSHAFGKTAWRSVHAEAIGSNKRSIRFHLALGFEQTGVTENAFFDGEKHEDIYHFCINKENWLNAKRVKDNESA